MKRICFPLVLLSFSMFSVAQAPQGVRGTIKAVRADNKFMQLQTDKGTENVQLAKGFTLYTRVTSSLAHVKSDSFVGITTVKVSGVERASEIHIFPAALRGLGEGSRMMGSSDSSGKANRMTNGTIKRMGLTKPSRMTNGRIVKQTGAGLLVGYKGGTIKITVPPGVMVTEIVKANSSKLHPGLNVFALGKQMPDKSWVAKTVMITSPKK